MNASTFTTILGYCLLALAVFYCMIDIYFSRKAKYDGDKASKRAKSIEIVLQALLANQNKSRDENKG